MAIKFVIDASVALKWQFKDESETEASIQMLTDFIEGKIFVFSPTLFIYEVVSAIHIAVSRHRIIEDEGIEIIRDILQMGLVLNDFSGLEENTLHMATTYKRSVYDCAYLALAQRGGCNFYTGDKRLFNSIKNKLPFYPTETKVRYCSTDTASYHRSEIENNQNLKSLCATT